MLGVLVQKWLGGVVNLTKETGMDHSAWRFGSKMVYRERLGRLDQSYGPDDESDKMNLMKKTVLTHSAWCVGIKWIGGSSLAELICWVDPMGRGQYGPING